MKGRLALVLALVLACQPAAAAAAGQVDADDINDFVVKISRDIAGFLQEAGAGEVALHPFKKADDDGDYPFSEVLTGQLLQELRFNQKGYAVVGPGESTAAFRVTGVWKLEGDEVTVVTRIVKMPAGEVDITYTGTIPLRRVPKVYLARGLAEGRPDRPDRGVRVAVMDFDGVGERYPRIDSLARSIPETITTVFARQSDLLLIERMQRDKIMAELALAESRYTDPDAVVEIGRLLGANYMIVGSYQMRGRKVRLQARRVKVESSEIFEAASVTGLEEDLWDLEEALANALLADIQRYR